MLTLFPLNWQLYLSWMENSATGCSETRLKSSWKMADLRGKDEYSIMLVLEPGWLMMSFVLERLDHSSSTQFQYAVLLRESFVVSSPRMQIKLYTVTNPTCDTSVQDRGKVYHLYKFLQDSHHLKLVSWKSSYWRSDERVNKKMSEGTHSAVISSKTWSEESEKSEARSFKDCRVLCFAGRLRRLDLLAGMVEILSPHIERIDQGSSLYASEAAAEAVFCIWSCSEVKTSFSQLDQNSISAIDNNSARNFPLHLSALSQTLHQDFGKRIHKTGVLCVNSIWP